jgi:hypothetical protein
MTILLQDGELIRPNGNMVVNDTKVMVEFGIDGSDRRAKIRKAYRRKRIIERDIDRAKREIEACEHII